MANAEHLRRLREASAARNIAAWNNWREENRIIPLLQGGGPHQGGPRECGSQGSGPPVSEPHWQIGQANADKHTKLPADLQRPVYW